MTTRTVKIMGSAYSSSGNVSIAVDYDGSRVFTGDIPTINVGMIPIGQPNEASDWKQELGLFETDTEITGNIPVTVTVTNGKLFFGHFWMNYIGPLMEREQVDPGIPIDPTDPSTYRWVEILDTQSNYGGPNTNSFESDGVTNTMLNDQTWNIRTNITEELLGDWAYPLDAGDTFKFDFYVDPDKIVI
jgi:hypothetical protein